MAVELGYFTLPVPDVARGTRFFSALFGWQFAEIIEAYAHVSNTKLPLGLNRGNAGDLSTLYFRVEDIESVCAKVRTLGGSAGAIEASSSGRSAVCVDDQGARFGVWQAAQGY